ncbi:hypothetical protein [Frankia sp. Cppng1_Ct_nod]|uniref:hypothetical protein n=1 Tax=Frankia sp. Cppng1_Ct_nod TaxID=2897162 RepID=UPI001A946F40|nr:hypothetical protein [Frankia sp. Cppng1_Ct_nod]
MVATLSLRRRYASVLFAAGESVIAVAERLGHGNAALALSIYGRLMPDSEDRTRKAVDSAWSRVTVVERDHSHPAGPAETVPDQTLKRNSTTSPSAMT